MVDTNPTASSTSTVSDADYWIHAQEIRKEFAAKYCLCYETDSSGCGGGIVKAHTVQRSLLANISRDGHVYGLLKDAATVKRNSGGLQLGTIGLKKASTFTGLCSRHDNRIFEPVEKHPFNSTHEQCCLLGYRPILREVFAKQAALNCGDTFDKINSTRNAALFKGIRFGLDRIKKHKSMWDAMLRSNDFSDVRFVVLHFPSTPDVMMSSAWHPTSTFGGLMLPNADRLEIPHVLPDLLTCSILGDERSGSCVMAWHRDSDESCDAFITSLVNLPPQDLSNALLRFVFQTSENVFARPEYWEGLQERQRQSLIARTTDAANCEAPIRETDLIDDGEDYAVSLKPTLLTVRLSTDDGGVEEYQKTYIESGLRSVISTNSD